MIKIFFFFGKKIKQKPNQKKFFWKKRIKNKKQKRKRNLKTPYHELETKKT